MKKKVLFLCTHNSARSQMAEGLLRHLAGDRFEVYSAGTEKTYVRPLAIKAMQEIGIDISGQHSKTLDQFLQERFDYVITVCDSIKEVCPYFPEGKQKLHWDLPDPSKTSGPEEAQIKAYISVRDELQRKLKKELLQ